MHNTFGEAYVKFSDLLGAAGKDCLPVEWMVEYLEDALG